MKKVRSAKVGLRVLHDRVLLNPDAPDKYQGVLEIPDAYRAFYENLPSGGTIVSFGPDCKVIWEVGQRVRFAKMAAAKVKYNDTTYLVLREYDIDAIEEPS